MNSSRYEQLLDELQKSQQEQLAQQTDQKPEQLASLDDLEDRLLDQQASLMHSAAELRVPPPHLTVTTEKAAEQDPGETHHDVESAIQAAHHEADKAEAASAAAMRRARLPNFLPMQRPVTRHLAVYALSGCVASLWQILMLSTGELGSRAWVFAAAPVAAFLAGYLVVGYGDKSRLRPPKRRRQAARPRDAKLGLIVCVVINFAVAAWWLLQTFGGLHR